MILDSDQARESAAGPAGLQTADTAALELEMPLSTPFASVEWEPSSPPLDPPAPSGSAQRTSSLFLRAVPQSGVEIFAFGRGDDGQLGDSNASDSSVPHQISALLGRDIVSLAASEFHSAAATADGDVYAWGDCDSGQCGSRGLEKILSPTRVEALESVAVALVACGHRHTVTVAEDGAAVAFGSNEFGQLGSVQGAEETKVTRPRAVRAPRNARIARVAAGAAHTLALTSGGQVLSFGDASFGRLGREPGEGPFGASVPVPVLQLWPLGVVQVSCGEAHSAALTVDGAIFTWGEF
jgi:alpha-tubulin suppressor-like RCC1 family protein